MASLLLALLDPEQIEAYAAWPGEKREALMKVLYDMLYREYEVAGNVGQLLGAAIRRDDDVTYYASVLHERLKREIDKYYDVLKGASD